MGVVLVLIAWVTARSLWPSEWIGPSFWEDAQKATLILVVFVVLSLLVALLRAPYAIYKRQVARITALEQIASNPPAPVSPLQQTFNFVVTSPEQASAIAQNFTNTQGAPQGSTVVSESGEGSETTTVSVPSEESPEEPS